MLNWALAVLENIVSSVMTVVNDLVEKVAGRVNEDRSKRRR